MKTINLQNKAKLKEGTIEYYWFENENVGFPKTRFHRITIPLEPFDSGLEYIAQPENTELVIDWIRLDINPPSLLAGVDIDSGFYNDMEASIYIGAAHNWVNVRSLHL